MRAIERLLAQDAFAGRASVRSIFPIAVACGAFAVCIPVCNEQALLPATLASLEQALSREAQRGSVVFVVNDTDDGSLTILARWASTLRGSTLIVETHFDAAIRGAPFARRLALDIGACLAPRGAVLTTDADTRVHPDWVAANLRHLRGGADLVCGTIRLDEHDASLLPTSVHECGALEREYEQCLARLWQLWTGGSYGLIGIQALGASLAISTRCYRAIGNLPTPAAGEDKALARLVRERGYMVAHAPDVQVVTSGRIEGRASGGVSDALRERMTSKDPSCDEALVPVAVLKRRAHLWNMLAGSTDPYLSYDRQCREDSQLSTMRMRLSDVVRELRIARRILTGPSSWSAEGMGLEVA